MVLVEGGGTRLDLDYPSALSREVGGIGWRSNSEQCGDEPDHAAPYPEAAPRRCRLFRTTPANDLELFVFLDRVYADIEVHKAHIGQHGGEQIGGEAAVLLFETDQ